MLVLAEFEASIGRRREDFLRFTHVVAAVVVHREGELQRIGAIGGTVAEIAKERLDSPHDARGLATAPFEDLSFVANDRLSLANLGVGRDGKNGAAGLEARRECFREDESCACLGGSFPPLRRDRAASSIGKRRGGLRATCDQAAGEEGAAGDGEAPAMRQATRTAFQSAFDRASEIRQGADISIPQ
jgi:hypothetical protein